MPSGKFDEVAEQMLPEMLPSCRHSHGDRMHIANRFGLRNETEQIGQDLSSFTNDEGGVSKLVDKERMVQVTSVASVPEFRQVFKNLIVILLRAQRYFSWVVHIRLVGPRGRSSCNSGSVLRVVSSCDG